MDDFASNTRNRHSEVWKSNVHPAASVLDDIACNTLTDVFVQMGLPPQADQVYAARQITLNHAFSKNPERFVNKSPKPPSKPTAAWINPPIAKLKVQV